MFQVRLVHEEGLLENMRLMAAAFPISQHVIVSFQQKVVKEPAIGNWWRWWMSG